MRSKLGFNTTIELFVFLSIMLIASLARLLYLGTIPNGFHSDEVLNGYIGKYILTNGVDIYGNSHPLLYFNNFGDYPNVIPMYLSGAFAVLYDSTIFSVRLPIALFGVFTVLLTYFFVKWLFKDSFAAAIAAIVIAISPWHIVLSRATAENITASFVFFAGLFLIFISIERNKYFAYIVGFLLLLTTYFLYPAQRIIVPLSLLPLLLIPTTKKFKYLITISVVLAFFLTVLISTTVWGKGRFEQTSVFSYNNTIQGRAEQYATGLGDNHILEARIFHNKILLAGMETARQYVSYFSPTYFFDDVGMPIRYRVFEHGIGFYTVLLICVVAVALQFISPISKIEIEELFHKERKKYWLILTWIVLVAPIPAALTLDDVPNIHRATVVGISSLFLIAGAVAVIRKQLIGRRYVIPIILILLFSESLIFFHYYFKLGSLATTPFRSDEQNTLAHWLIQNRLNYEQIFVPNSEAIALHYLFFNNDYSIEYASRFSLGAKITDIDNVQFVDNNCPTEEVDILEKLAASTNSAVIVRAECDVGNLNLKFIDSISHYNQTKAYKIFAYGVEKL